MENKTIYIHETHTLYAENGELHLLYDDGDYDKQLVFNVETLYNDLPNIIRLCVEEKNKMDKFFLDNLKKTVAKL